MKSKFLLIAVLAIGLAGCGSSASKNKKQAAAGIDSFVGDWSSEFIGENEMQTRTFGLHLEKDNAKENTLKGWHCSIVRGGRRIDCIETDEEPSITGTLKNDTVYIHFVSSFGGKGQAKLYFDETGEKLVWKMGESSGENYLPIEDVLNRETKGELSNEIDGREFSEQKYLIRNNGVDIFLIGQDMPTQADGYSITKSIETREEEGEEFEMLVYTVSENGQEMLNVEKYVQNEDASSDRIDNIFLLSDKYKTAKNIGLHSTIEEFTVAYPDFTIWFSYISGWYVIETEQLDGIQFFLDGNDFIEEGGPKFESDRTILKPSEFKKGSKITGIRIWG